MRFAGLKQKAVTSVVFTAVFIFSTAANADTMKVATELMSVGRYTDAQLYLETLTQAGDAEAMLLLGRLKRDGLGSAEDAARAAELFESSNKQGNVEAGHLLARLLSDGDGIPEDDVRAFGLFLEAAKAGNSVAQNRVGYTLSEGEGVAADETEACRWFSSAAEQDLSDSVNSFGTCLQYGRASDVPQDFIAARVYYEKAVSLGNTDAYFGLGELYAHGWGVVEDRAKALEFYERVLVEGYDDEQKADAQEAIDAVKAGKRLPAPGGYDSGWK